MNKQNLTHIHLQDLLGMRHYLPSIALFRSPLERSTLLGMHRSRLRGRGMDFDQVRAYQSGDDARSIDWRVTARTGTAHTKILHEESERPTFILVEQSLHLFFASTGCFKSVIAAQAASLFAWGCYQHNNRVGGLIFDHSNVLHIPLQRNRHSLLHFLQAIAEANQRLQQPMTQPLENPLANTLQHALQMTQPGSLIILICNEQHLNAQSSQLLQRLAQQTNLILLPLSDPFEHNLPLLQQARFSMGTERLKMDTGHKKVRQQWQHRAASYQRAWQTLAQQLNAPLIPLSTAQPIVQQLQAISLASTRQTQAAP